MEQQKPTKRQARKRVVSEPIELAKVEQTLSSSLSESILPTPKKRSPRKPKVESISSPKIERNEIVSPTADPIVVSPVPVQAVTEVEHKPTKQHKKVCTTCSQRIKPAREKKPPSDAQKANQQKFRDSILKAKELQAKTPGLTYRQAIAEIYKQNN